MHRGFAWIAPLLVTCIAGCRSAAPPSVVAPEEVSPPAVSSPAEAPNSQVWTPPPEATKEAIRRECLPVLDALQGTTKGEPAEIVKAVRDKLDAMSNGCGSIVTTAVVNDSAAMAS